MNTIFSWKNKKATNHDIHDLFVKGMPIYLISWNLGVSQEDCVRVLA